MIRFIGVAQFVRDDVLERTDVVRVISGLRRLGQEVGWTKAARTEYAVEWSAVLCNNPFIYIARRGAGEKNDDAIYAWTEIFLSA